MIYSVEFEQDVDVLSDELQIGKDVVINMHYLTRLISLMSKYTLLVGTAIASTFTVMLLLILDVIFVRGNINPYLEESIFRVFITIDALVNIICLALQFRFAKRYYLKICLVCHGKCENRYTNQTNDNSSNSVVLQRLPSGELVFSVNKGNVEIPDNEQGGGGMKSISLVAQKSENVMDA